MHLYPTAPFALLLIAALGIVVQSFAITLACNVCIFRTISYLRSSTMVLTLMILNTATAYVLETNGIEVVSLVGVAAGLVISTGFLMLAIPTDAVSAFLVLVMSLAVTIATGLVLAVVTNGSLLYAW